MKAAAKISYREIYKQFGFWERTLIRAEFKRQNMQSFKSWLSRSFYNTGLEPDTPKAALIANAFKWDHSNMGQFYWKNKHSKLNSKVIQTS